MESMYPGTIIFHTIQLPRFELTLRMAGPAGSFMDVPVGGSITVLLRGGTTNTTSATTVSASTAATEAAWYVGGTRGRLE